MGFAIGDKVRIEIDKRLHENFQRRPERQPLLYIDSRGRVAVAVIGEIFRKCIRYRRPDRFLFLAKANSAR